MRVFMLGWEFPPHITGGLGTACYGLTKAMNRLPVDITFVLPRPVQPDPASPVRVVPQRPNQPAHATTTAPIPHPTPSAHHLPTHAADSTPPAASANTHTDPRFPHTRFHHLPAQLPASPHGPVPGGYGHRGPALHTQAAARHASASAQASSVLDADFPASPDPAASRLHATPGSAAQRASDTDLLASSHRYAHLCLQLAHQETFDVIHAHDWMTFPAGMAVAAATGKPLVVHVHSTEFDRAGEAIDYRIFDIERRGLHAAVRVVAVSHLTRSILVNRYDIEPDRIDVVYNGIDHPDVRWPDDPKQAAIQPADRIVLFLGRITMQKGPEYFVEAAKRVLEHEEKVKFIVAGSGDKVPDIIRLAAREGLGHKVLFTGFLDQADVDRVFGMADVYVMPSVSEPFGIAALEAIRHDVPIIISRTAGVSEVIQHALKVDFWNVDDIADKILAVLRHAPLAETLRRNAEIEVRKLTWLDAARKVRRIYDTAIAAMPT
ncbi:MAG: glycosyltransferase [Phycisphaeraceae bacterium]